ncbi:glutamate--cysteine ligase [Corynebacterium hylobatis]|uniref:Glutamate--cysteine ligase n=1 Tax=Corynebacterium hylobatis TaxID=1859290 RepID=A0A430HVB2_9CORY|nr:glutamate-cysteine ligase family protein [Corynebacterium hylobatis]RSZ61286.1 glutamate--cysteine ligase [Corynebacterium hylobatis]
MGDAVSKDTYTPQQRTKYRQQLMNDLEVFDQHLQKAEFGNRGTIGLELELNLVDEDMQPLRKGTDVLELLGEEYQSEIGLHNVELNHPPLTVAGDGLRQLHEGITARVTEVRQAAEQVGARIAMIGTLPTITPEFLAEPGWMTPENRYRALNNAIMQSRGELVHIDFANEEEFRHEFEDISPESTCTSMQLHLQVPPNRFASAWNASQAMAAVQVALSANSPLFLGRKLWHESRVPVFQQSIDTRTPELVAQGVRPRVWFGERWINSVFDLFEENVRYFSPLLPEAREDSGKPIIEGQSPTLHHLNLHNGTVWRWNRPIYAPGKQRAHIRVENRILAAGPTITDIVADAAFYYGLVKYLAEETRPVWSRLPFETAEQNFTYGARAGMFARLDWPTLGRIDVATLIQDHLLDQACEGLRALDVDEDLITYYLDIIRQRARTRQNGAMWQLRTLKALTPTGSKPNSPERRAALAEMLRLYLAHQSTEEPVHTWKIGG